MNGMEHLIWNFKFTITGRVDQRDVMKGEKIAHAE
jgi:hypothetical protein